jgi:branched-chain amino acid transport system permease protein
MTTAPAPGATIPAIAVTLAETSNIMASGHRLRLLMVLLLAIIVVVAPMFVYPIFLMKLMCFALFACSLNLLLGYTGLLSFGHAAFFGMGSYDSAYVLKYGGVTPEVGILGGTLVGVLLGAAFGSLAIRRQGIYFAMITLALGQLVYFLSIQNPWFTGGEDGIHGLQRGRLFGLIDLSNDMTLYAVIGALFILGLLFVIRVVQSPFGEVLRAVRDNPDRATSLGYHVSKYRLLAFTLSAGLAGLAGAMKALVFQAATLNDVHWSMSGQPILMTLVGGLGTIFGPVIGAIVFVTSEAYLTYLGSWVMVIQGAVFFFCVLFFRRGLLGTLPERLRRWL